MYIQVIYQVTTISYFGTIYFLFHVSITWDANILLDHFPTIDTTKKGLSTLSSTSTSSSLMSTGSGSGDKKAAGSHSIISSLKRFVSDVGNNNNGISSTTSAASECREELDGVERGEGTPLSHLTASRAKAPRRRPPSSQHLRHHAAGSNATSASSPTHALLVLWLKKRINIMH